jgi:hypothetical protein
MMMKVRRDKKKNLKRKRKKGGRTRKRSNK